METGNGMNLPGDSDCCLTDPDVSIKKPGVGSHETGVKYRVKKTKHKILACQGLFIVIFLSFFFGGFL